MLADPAQPGTLGQSFLKHWRAVGEHAVAKRTGHFFDTANQAPQTAAQHLVVVPSQGVSGHIAADRVRQRLFSAIKSVRQVVEPDRNHPLRPGHQFLRARTAHPVALHVAHLAMPAACQPIQQMYLMLLQVQVGNSHLIEAKFPAPSMDGTRKIRRRIGHGRKGVP